MAGEEPGQRSQHGALGGMKQWPVELASKDRHLGVCPNPVRVCTQPIVGLLGEVDMAILKDWLPVGGPLGSGRKGYRAAVALSGAALLAAAGCGSASAGTNGASAALGSAYGSEYENTGTGPLVTPTIPDTPSVGDYFGSLRCSAGATTDPRKPAPSSCTRVFHLTAMQFVQQVANFPHQSATVWGFQAGSLPPSTPGRTLISYAGERVQIVETNELPEPTTIHPHGLHQPNIADGVAGVSQPNPIQPGTTYDYPAFRPGHVGTFAYHSHFDSAVQEMRGLDGMWVVLPRAEHQSVHVAEDEVMTLQIWDFQSNDQLVKPFGEPVGGKFPYDTINGKTGDASGGPITIHNGDLVRIRVYNASQEVHAMHLHGQDEVLVAKNGHEVAPVRETTQTVSPGDFFDIEFRADNPGNWIFHCHFPHHTTNGMNSGYNGAPVGMTRIFHYAGYALVPSQYFSDAHYMSPTAMQ